MKLQSILLGLAIAAYTSAATMPMDTGNKQDLISHLDGQK